MPDIMARCATLGTAVPTGLTTEAIKFESIPDIAIPFQCPACLKTHTWRPKTAWVDGVDKDRPRQHVRLVKRG
jgi:hypothetical protein